jgi:hypothetical protein
MWVRGAYGEGMRAGPHPCVPGTRIRPLGLRRELSVNGLIPEPVTVVGRQRLEL